jgi:hypothetical protein
MPEYGFLQVDAAAVVSVGSTGSHAPQRQHQVREARLAARRPVHDVMRVDVSSTIRRRENDSTCLSLITLSRLTPVRRGLCGPSTAFSRSLLHLFGRYILDVRRDVPAVAVGIYDSTRAVAVELVGDRPLFGGAGL